MKIENYCLILLFMVIFSQSCKEISHKIPTINLTELSPSNVVDISSYIADISYTPLQTEENYFIRYISKAIFTADCILIGNSNRDLYCFDYKGSFIRRIDHIGNGPGEYTSMVDFAYNESLKNIYILASHKIYEFSIEGKFVKSFEINDPNPVTIESIDNWIVVHNNNDTGKTPVSFSIYRENGTLLRSIPNPYLFEVTGTIYSFAHECLFYKYDHQLYLKEFHSDTVFRFSPDTFTPAWCFNTNGRSITTKVRNSKEYDINSTSYFMFSQLAVMKESFLTRYAYKGKGYITVIPNTANHKTSTFQLGNEKVNAIDGGFPIDPQTIINRNGAAYFVRWIDAIQLKAHVASEAFKTSTPKYPEKKKALEKLVNRLSENDNPVLMLAKLKE